MTQTGPDTQVELNQVQQSIIDAVAAQFPAVQTVADYRENRSSLPTPAILIELEEFEAAPDEDPGTEQLAARCRFVARIVIGFRTEKAEREIRRLAAALAAFVHQNRWGQPVEPAEVLTAAPDDFDADLDQFVVWSVEWQQIVHLGATVWTAEGLLPPQVVYSWSPDIGPGNEGEYEPIRSGSPITVRDDVVTLE